ncbi:alpha/beta fold hydrolase [Actinoplanes sp. NPDC051851]|uniref:alpha/beta hydrolase n=1 Tax=Actinoplanes sp. NPDC051851 TaxID=3154753 RepID=UPI00342F5252
MSQPTALDARQRTGWPRHLAGILTAFALIAALLNLAGPANAQPRSSPRHAASGCARHDIHVTLTPARSATRYRVAGWLCRPRARTDTVQLLLSGLTYNHTYWTGISPTTNWTSAALEHGQAVYMIDRIGIGASDHPPADQVTVDSEALVTHQIATALRDGRLGRYAHVIGVGHSYGSITLTAEAAQHHDLDALVLTGKQAQYNQPGLVAFQSSLYPAHQDPKFAGTLMPDGYLTTPPASRAGFFLNPDTTAPGAARWQEATKATATTGELSSISAARYQADSQRVQVPVLIIDGSNDSLFCNTSLPCQTDLQLCERAHDIYAAGTPVFSAVVPGAGHAIDLHRNAPIAFTAADRWISRVITGQATYHPEVTTCRR